MLDHFRSKSQLDADCLDLTDISSFGPIFSDCTSNQADAYYEFLNPTRLPLLKESVRFARNVHGEHTGLSLEQLVVDVAVSLSTITRRNYMPVQTLIRPGAHLKMIKICFSVLPLIRSTLFVMINPTLSYSTPRVVDNVKRIYKLAGQLDPKFPLSRLCVKVPATWEGLRACSELGRDYRTLATTCFTLEQAVLAAEVGCAYVSPFCHELGVFFDDSFVEEGEPILQVCVRSQAILKARNYATKVKACCLTSVDEVAKLAGVDNLTIGPSLVKNLQATTGPREELEAMSLFQTASTEQRHAEDDANLTFVNDEEKFRKEFAAADGGIGERKTKRVRTRPL